jgi:hypothetical protein
MHRVLTEISEDSKTGNVYTANIILRRVHVTIHTVDNKLVLLILKVYFAALGIRHAICMRHIVICAVYASTTFFHIIS